MTSILQTAERKQMHSIVQSYESIRINLVLVYLLIFLCLLSMCLFALISKSYAADLCIQFVHSLGFLYIGIRYAHTRILLKKAKEQYDLAFETRGVL